MTLKSVLKGFATKKYLPTVLALATGALFAVVLEFGMRPSSDPWYAPTYYDNPPAKLQSSDGFVDGPLDRSGELKGGDSFYPAEPYSEPTSKGTDLYVQDSNHGNGYTFYPDPEKPKPK